MPKIMNYTGQDFYIIVELNDYDGSIRYTHGMFDTAEEAYASIAEFQPRIDSVYEVWSKEKYQAIR